MSYLNPDSALARAMAAERSRFNARISEARKMQSSFDIEAFTSWLTDHVAPLAECIAESNPVRSADTAVLSGFTSASINISLILVAHGLATGTALPLFEELWRKVLPECITLLSEQPRETLGVLHNALLNIRSSRGGNVSRWILSMSALAGKASTLKELRVLCSVLAWKSGLAHYRTGALLAAETLSTDLTREALNIPSGMEASDALARFAEDRWFDPSVSERTPLNAVHELGSFTGFGGTFPSPPTVRADSEGFAVKSSDRYFWLYADAFGAVLHASSEAEYKNAVGTPPGISATGAVLHNGELQSGTNRVKLHLPEDGLSLTCTFDTAAVFSRWSYSILLFPLLRGSRR